jgi:hypothetical protein
MFDNDYYDEDDLLLHSAGGYPTSSVPSSLSAPILQSGITKAVDVCRRLFPSEVVSEMGPSDYPRIWSLRSGSQDSIRRVQRVDMERVRRRYLAVAENLGIPIIEPKEPDLMCLDLGVMKLERMLSDHAKRVEARDPCPLSLPYLSSDLFALKVGDQVRAGSYDMFLLCLDVSRKRACVRICRDVVGMMPESTLESWLSIVDETLSSLGNEGYHILKLQEALFKGRTLDIRDMRPENLSSFEKTIRAMRDLNLSGILCEKIRGFALSVTDFRVTWELFGIAKINGFPVIDEVKSTAKARRIGTTPDESEPGMARHLALCLKSLILEGYVSSKGQWPPFIVPPKAGSKLESDWKIRSHVAPALKYDPEDFSDLQFGQLFELDERVDSLETLDDKYCAPRASITDGSGRRRYAGANSRSVVEAALAGGHRSPSETLAAWADGKYFAEDMVVRTSIKGLEPKVEGRLFAMMTYEGREARSIMERGIQYGLQKILPQSTKRMSEQELGNTLSRISAQGGSTAEIDFSSWNLRFNLFNTRGCAEVVSSIYGRPGLWESVHEQFYLSTIYLTVGGVVPGNEKKKSAHDFVENDYCWRGHMGGLEGQFQGFWEVCTFAIMQAAIRDTGGTGDNFGQGDNQLVCWKQPDLSVASALTDGICKFISRTNHEAKPEEVEYGNSFTYKKRLFSRGTEIRSVLKHVVSCLSIPSSIAPTVQNRLALPHATMASISNHLEDPLLAWVCGEYLTRAAIAIVCVQDQDNSRQRILERIVEVPSAAGGYPIPPISAYLWRGHCDPLSSSIGSCLLTGGVGLSVFLHHLSNPPKAVDLAHLVDDPTSFPMDRPQDPGQATIAVIDKVVVAAAKAGTYAGVFRKKPTRVREKLAALFKAGTPLSPQLANDIMMRSHDGVRSRVLKRFNTTSSFQRLAMKAGHNLPSRVWEADHKLYLWLSGLVSTLQDVDPRTITESIFSMATKLRSHWGVQLPAGITTLSPFDYVKGQFRGSGTISVAYNLRPEQSVRKFYRGSRTEQRYIRPLEEFKSNTSTGEDVKTLMRIRSQIQLQNGFLGAIDDVLRSRLGMEPSSVESDFPRAYGGTDAHRLDGMDRAQYDLGCSPLVPSWSTVSTDDFGVGSRDLPISFQELMLFHMCRASIMFARGIPGAVITAAYKPETLPEVVPWSNTTVVWKESEVPVPGNPLLTLTEYMVQKMQVKSLPPSGLSVGGRVHPRDLVAARILGTFSDSPSMIRLMNGDIFTRDKFDRSEVEGIGPSVIDAGVARVIPLILFSSLAVTSRSFDARITLHGMLIPICKAVASLYFTDLTKSSAGRSWLASREIRVGVGSKGHDAWFTSYANYLAARVSAILTTKPKNPVPARIVVPSWGISREKAYSLVMISAVIHGWRGMDIGSPSALADFRSAYSRQEDRNKRLIHLKGPVGESARAWSANKAYLTVEGTPLELLRSLRALNNMRTMYVRPSNLPRKRREVLSVISDGTATQVYTPGPPDRPLELPDMTKYYSRLYSTHGSTSLHESYDCLPDGTGLAYSVGFGQGGAAAALILSGYIVLGIELRTALPDYDGALSSYCPPEVERIGGQDQFAVHSMCWSSSGDWMDIGVASLENGPGLVYLGIEQGGLNTDLRILDPIINSGWVGDLVIRVLGDSRLVELFYATLFQVGIPQVFAPIQVADTFSSHVSVTMKGKLDGYADMVRPLVIEWKDREYSPSLARMTEKGGLAVTKAMFRGLYGTSGLSLFDAYQALKEVADEAEVNTRRYVPKSVLMDIRFRLDLCKPLLAPGIRSFPYQTIRGLPRQARNIMHKVIGIAKAFEEETGMPFEAIVRDGTPVKVEDDHGSMLF